LLVAPDCFGCLVRRQTERPPLNIFVQPHCDSVALKTSPREDLFSSAILYRCESETESDRRIVPAESPALTVKQKRTMFVPLPG
jgi:hypothetical protein